ncbi:hypothetical protein DFH94DRAFT_635563 [Russula ochroleuca]|uniref:F-box domain-containing protein n=1 Tax=Russula ochroleuca TaxID=152965 RepID=A0A9P5MRK8_9AGAM|nr:hypothetical protein DFH94DRAFT_635563 [Russula ochroleuca]
MLPLPPHRDLGNGLPNEILSTIFDYLSHDALTRVALVSRRWRANAERVLYSTIIIHEFQTMVMMLPAVPITTLRCCETLFARPRLTEYVRRFHIRWDTDVVESPLLLLRIAQNIVRTLVPSLVHLDSLELSFGLAPHFPASAYAPHNNAPQSPQSLENSPPPPASIPTPPDTQKPHGTAQLHQLHHQLYHLPLLLPPLRLPSLRTLALHGIGTPPAPDLSRLLQNHPSLQHLRLSDYRCALHLTPADVPHLRSFRGYPATAASLLPGRPVQALALVGCCELATEEDLVRIARGSVPVKALDLSGMSVTPALLRSVSRHLSQVEWLKVRLALRYALSGSIVRHRLLTALTTVLAAFYNLRSLDLSPTNANDAMEEQHLCITWLGACPSLRRVVFPSQTEWSLSEAGTWISGSGSRSPGSLPRWYLGAS